MANTYFEIGSGVEKAIWEEETFKDIPKESYWLTMAGIDLSDVPDPDPGRGQDSVFRFERRFAMSKGDKVNFTLIPRVDKPLNKNVAIEGSENKINAYTFSSFLDFYHTAIRDSGPLVRQRVWFDLDEKSKEALVVNWAEGLDLTITEEMFSNPTKILVATGSPLMTSVADIASAKALLQKDNVVTMNLFSWIFACARTGFNRKQIPLSPIKSKGNGYYVFLTSFSSVADLINDPGWKQAQREADLRSPDNPIFTGAMGVYNNVIIRPYENTPIGIDAGVGLDVPYSQNIVLGKDSLALAVNDAPEVVGVEFDYKTEHGLAMKMLASVKKPNFNSNDYGSFQVFTSNSGATNL